MQQELEQEVKELSSIKGFDWRHAFSDDHYKSLLQSHFHFFNHIELYDVISDTRLEIELSSPQLLDWRISSPDIKLSERVSLSASYTLLSSRSLVISFSALIFVWFCYFITLFFFAGKAGKRLFKLERKARKMANAKRRSEHLKYRSFTRLLDSLLDELSWSREEQLRVDKFIRSQTFLDPELGIGNRMFFDHRLEAVLNEDDTGQLGAVAFLHFHELDKIENLYGVDFAQDILTECTDIVSRNLNLSSEALLARRTYMELAILMPAISNKVLEKTANQIINALHHVQLPDEVEADSFFHIGIARYKAKDSAYQVLYEADMALKTAELQGPNGWFVYDNGDEQGEPEMGTLKWRTYLDNVIKNERFLLSFQAVMKNGQDKPHHYEVLVKVPDQEQGQLNAQIFRPMAKKCGLQTKIDQIVLERLFAMFRKSEDKACSASVHLSLESLLNADFLAWFDRLLSYNQQHSDKLIIELNELTLKRHSDAIEGILTDLSKKGVRILIAQVGQYVVNASYLKQHPITYLKLHTSVVRNIQQRPENQLFLRSLKSACASSHIRVFANGVETEDEWEMLSQLDIDGGQGHYFSNESFKKLPCA